MAHSEASTDMGWQAPEVFLPQSALEVSPNPRKVIYPYHRDDEKHSFRPYTTMIAPSSETSNPSPARPRQLLLGIIIGAIAAAIVVGAALGGGLGKSLSTCRNPVTTVLEHNYQPRLPQDVDTLYNACAGGNTTTSYNKIFQIFCDTDFGYGKPGTTGGNVSDVLGIVAYTLTDCMTACSAFNDKAVKWNYTTMLCRGVTFRYDMRNLTLGTKGNCWLKSDVPKNRRDWSDNLLSASAQWLTS